MSCSHRSSSATADIRAALTPNSPGLACSADILHNLKPRSSHRIFSQFTRDARGNVQPLQNRASSLGVTEVSEPVQRSSPARVIWKMQNVPERRKHHILH